MQALIICNDGHITWPLPYLLARSGFTVDVIGKTGLLRKSKYVNSVTVLADNDNIATRAIERVRERPGVYDWIIVTEDFLLQDIALSSASDAIKLEILPVLSNKDFVHLFSKIGLSQTLEAHGIRTPPYGVATTLTEALRVADGIGFPVMLKADASHGGNGTYECLNRDDLRKLGAIFDGTAYLIQKKIEGQSIDLSALYRDGQLIHFNYSIMQRFVKKFGPSKMRDYLSPEAIPSVITAELRALGQALGANGFANITCIEDGDTRYYIEADMRPNSWVDATAFFGDDIASKIKQWFTTKSIKSVAAISSATGVYIRIPNFMCLDNFEILTNRYKVWRYIPFHDRELVLRLLFLKLVVRPMMKLAKTCLPPHIRKNVKKVMVKSGAF